MSDPKPNPTLNAEGLPLCSEDACALYDGKRCRAIGFRPGTYCEPALVELVEKAKGAERPQVSAVPDSMLYVMEIGDEVPMNAFVRMKNAAAALQKSWAEQWKGPGICPSIIVTRPSTRVYPANLPPDVAVLIAEREGLASANAELGAMLVDLRRSLAEMESVRTEQAEKLRRHLDELAAARARIEEYEALLLACPMGHHDGKIIWHRSTTEADLVAWVDRVHVEGRAGHAATRERAASVATTIEQAPPDDLLDQTRCPHRRVSMRPSPHGLPETTCLDCGEPTNP